MGTVMTSRARLQAISVTSRAQTIALATPRLLTNPYFAVTESLKARGEKHGLSCGGRGIEEPNSF